MKSQMIFYTYKITNKVTNKSYFGWTNKTPQKRLDIHVHTANNGSRTLLHNSIRKHGADAFTVETINKFHAQNDTLKDEIRLIAENQTNHCRYPNGGYNMTDGGEGVSGCRRTIAQQNASRRVILKRNHSLKGKTYEEIYGDAANSEKAKRTALVTHVPNNQTKQKCQGRRKETKMVVLRLELHTMMASLNCSPLKQTRWQR